MKLEERTLLGCGFDLLAFHFVCFAGGASFFRSSGKPILKTGFTPSREIYGSIRIEFNLVINQTLFSTLVFI